MNASCDQQGVPDGSSLHRFSLLVASVKQSLLRFTENNDEDYESDNGASAPGMIDWEDVASAMNRKLSDENRSSGSSGIGAAVGSRVTRVGSAVSAVECHKMWRYLAYGEVHPASASEGDSADSFQHEEDSDEVG